MNGIIQNYRTSTAGLKPSKLEDGQIAVNMASKQEALYIKNSNGEVVEFKPFYDITEDDIDRAFNGEKETDDQTK